MSYDSQFVDLYRQRLDQDVRDQGEDYIRKLRSGGVSENYLRSISTDLQKADPTTRKAMLANPTKYWDVGGPGGTGAIEETAFPGLPNVDPRYWQEHPIAAPLGVALWRANPGFYKGGTIPTSGLFSKAVATNLGTGVRNALTNEAVGAALEPIAAKIISPEEHPWLNMGTNIALWGALGHGVNRLRGGLTGAPRELQELAMARNPSSGSLTPTSSTMPAVASTNPLTSSAPSALGSSVVPSTGGFSALTGAWENMVGTPISNLASKLGSLEIPMPGLIKRQVGNTGSSLLNTPFDVLQNQGGGLGKIGEAFEDTIRESERMRHAMALVSQKISDKPLSWLNEFRNVLKGGLNLNKASVANRAEMAELLAPAFNALTDSKAKLLDNASQEKIVKNTLATYLSRAMKSNINDPHFKMAMGAFKGDLNTPEGTKMFLDSLISHPNTPPDTRQIALDLYNIRARTVQEVSNGYKASFEKVLMSKILENPEAARPLSEGAAQWMNDIRLGKVTTQLGDYVKAPERYKDLDGMMIHKTVAEGLHDMDVAPSAARRFISSYFMNPWKTMKVLLNMPARLRDPISQMIFNDVAGAHPLSPFRADQYARAAKMIRSNDPIYQRWKFWAGEPGALNDVDILPMINSMNHDAGPLDNFLRMIYDPSGFRVPFTSKEIGFNPMGKFTQYMSAVTKTFDTLTKLAKFDWNLKHGMAERDAMVDALRVNGDPLRMSRGTKLIKDYVAPFAGWQVHALKTMSHGIVHHPVRVAKYFALPAMMAQAAVSNLGLSEEEWQQFKETLPEYVKDEVMGMPTFIPLPYRDDKGRIQMMNLSWWIPGLQDMAELSQKASSPLGIIQNPVFTLASSIAQNKKFSGAPIYFEWEPPTTKMAKMIGFLGEQLTPAMTPGVGNAWGKIADSFSDNPEALTPMQALGGQVGMKLQPFEEGAQSAKHQSLLDSWHAQAMTRFRKEIEKHPEDPAAQEKIAEKYRKILQDIEMKRVAPSLQEAS